MARIVAALLVTTAGAVHPMPSTRPALYFPGGGLYYWWQAGVVERLQRSDHAAPVCGASAGALAATLYKCGVDMDAAWLKNLNEIIDYMDPTTIFTHIPFAGDIDPATTPLLSHDLTLGCAKKKGEEVVGDDECSHEE